MMSGVTPEGFVRAQQLLHEFENRDRIVATLTMLGWLTDRDVVSVGVNVADAPDRTVVTAYDWAGEVIASAELHADQMAHVLTRVDAFTDTHTPLPGSKQDTAVANGVWCVSAELVRNHDGDADRRAVARDMVLHLVSDLVISGDARSFDL